MRDALGDRGRKLRLALATALTLAVGLAATGAAEAASTVTVNPTSPTNTPFNAPFGQSVAWGAYMVWVYKDIPAFSLKPGDTVGFDLTAQNDVDIQLDIAMAPTTLNGGSTNSAPFTLVVPNSQVPANPRGNTTSGDYELGFTATAPFNFSGGGLLIRFSNPGGAFFGDPDTFDDGVLANNALPTDPSGYFVAREVRDADGSSPWTGDEYLNGIGGFRLNLLDVPPVTPAAPIATPTATPSAAPTPKKKCKKKKHKRAAASAKKKCKKKRR
jgi:hypothetical protein